MPDQIEFFVPQTGKFGDGALNVDDRFANGLKRHAVQERLAVGALEFFDVVRAPVVEGAVGDPCVR